MTGDVTPDRGPTGADLLRAAGALMRERARKATPGPWGDPTNINYGDFGWYVPGCPAGESPDDEQGRADTTHIASWHPAVALAVADWLDNQAGAQHVGHGCRYDHSAHALAVARAYLGHPGGTP